MSEKQDSILELISTNKVYQNADGSIFFNKTIQRFKFLMLNQDGKKIYDNTPYETKIVPITPEEMGFCKTMKGEKILIVKNIQSENMLSDTQVFFEMTLDYDFGDEKKYRTFYFYRCRSGRIMVRDFSSAVTFEAGVNSEWVHRGKSRKLEENTLISKTAKIYTLNSSGELELRLDPENVW